MAFKKAIISVEMPLPYICVVENSGYLHSIDFSLFAVSNISPCPTYVSTILF
jgi:hypothetical protein